MRVVVLGSTGYAGMVLVRILANHPDVTEITPVSRSAAGTAVRESDPGLGATIEKKVRNGNYVSFADADPANADAVVSALPHAASAELLGPLAGSVPIIDLSADFRLGNISVYEDVYQHTHPYPNLLEQAVYGLCEWNREEIRDAAIIANPGCYPTATLLPLLPFAELVESPIVVNALSGISGAGRKAKTNMLYGERSENANAYNPGRAHRHVPEIEEHLWGIPGIPAADTQLLFTPHLIPVKQGMVVTTFAALKKPISQSEAEERIREAYADSPFVGLSARGIPESRDVRNSNRCDIGVRVHDAGLQLFSVIDNLYKGASGQAVQNLNIRLGLAEDAGLAAHGEF
jgi:N-acetyl-gamma-glutamyl-phosphate reductase